MACYIYVSTMDEDRVDVYSMDGETGSLELAHQIPLEGGPAAIAIEPGRRFLYVVKRKASQFASFAIDQSDGSLEHLGTIAEESDSVYATSDATGRFHAHLEQRRRPRQQLSRRRGRGPRRPRSLHGPFASGSAFGPGTSRQSLRLRAPLHNPERHLPVHLRWRDRRDRPAGSRHSGPAHADRPAAHPLPSRPRGDVHDR